MEQIIQLDFVLFHFINQVWTNHYLDVFFSFMRNQYVWAPLYVFLIAYLVMNFGGKGWKYILMTVFIVLGSNYLSSELIKKNIHRSRPCNEVALEGHRRLLVHCGTGYSFTSSHATNHFSISVFFCLTGAVFMGRWRYLFLIWAVIISYAQIYVGVHFPLDILGGAFIGSIAGIIGSFMYKKIPFFQ
ncbi:MAG: phosphatase PAP2 family protein [Saprospiraceae bacterium]